jgi:hypothetical protein
MQVEDYAGKTAPLKDIVGDKLTLLVMTRHFGCLLCRDTAAKVLSVFLHQPSNCHKLLDLAVNFVYYLFGSIVLESVGI